jgi:hypothetical protein
MDYTEFEKNIKAIEKFIKDIRNLKNVLHCDGVVDFGSELLQHNIELLEIIFGDQGPKWIDYWIWELNFGEYNNKQKYGNRALTLLDEYGKEMPLETIEDLYNLLTSGD